MNNPLQRKSVVTRSYNDIVFEGDRVIKGVAQDRFLKEMSWFIEAKKRIPDNIPSIFTPINKPIVRKNNKNLIYYEMQAVDGDNLYQWSIENKDRVEEIFDRVVSLALGMHKELIKKNSEDIIEMYYSKPKTALEGFIKEKDLDPNLIKINNILVPNPILKLEKAFNDFREKLLDTRFSFIHGDLTMSNILIDKDERVYLIDPRGGFGSTKIYGDVRYDVAKFFYSIIGNFDSLNNGRFKYKYDAKNNNHTFSIMGNGLDFYAGKLLRLFKEDPEVIKFIHTTIWLSLIPHMSDNNDQQLCVFCNGVSLLNLLYE